MRRKIIAVVLAVALVAGRLGGFVYANPELVNRVELDFHTSGLTSCLGIPSPTTR